MTVSAVLFAFLAFIIGAAISAFLLLMYDRFFRDLGGPIYSAATPQALRDLVEVFSEFSQTTPLFWIPSKNPEGEVLVDRIAFTSGLIINFSSPDFRRNGAGEASIGYQMVCTRPPESAYGFFKWAQRKGYESEIIHDPDTSLAKGKMSFVIVNGLISSDPSFVPRKFVFVFRLHKREMTDEMPVSWRERPGNLRYAK
jgi:hypothetical protein